MASETVNHWPKSKCARAFWGQHELPPYKHLLADTIAWCDTAPGQRWLDLGCGCGKLTAALWAKSQGALQQIIGLDVAAVNEVAYAELRRTSEPPATEEQIVFKQADFSSGLGRFPANHFDGAVSGLAIQYAESFDADKGIWTTAAYDHLLREVYRVLRHGSSFVFSVNVPNPGWGRVALAAFTGLFRAPKMKRYIKNSLRMWRYGSWLSTEASRGRFHFLPVEEVQRHVKAAGFEGIEHRLSYAKQAYVVRCCKPGKQGA
jgi:ubiquinone/menaquinone biosynthesis C-methylase UbiE